MRESNKNLIAQSPPQTPESIERLFERVLGGKLDQAPQGSFDSKYEEIEVISFTKPMVRGGADASLNVVIYYESPEGKKRHFTWSISKEGVMGKNPPRELGVPREALVREILETLERIDLDFWHTTDLEIIPQKDAGERKDSVDIVEKTEVGKESQGERIDSERLAFLRNQPGVLFGFLNDRAGFRGYRGVVFPNFVVLENPTVKNAAFFVDLPERIEVDEKVFRLPSSKRVPEERREELLQQYWLSIAERAKTKGELRSILAATRIVHTPDTWRVRIQQEIDKRIARISQ